MTEGIYWTEILLKRQHAMHFIMGSIMPQWAESQRHMVVVKCVCVCVCACVCVCVLCVHVCVCVIL